MANSYPVTLNKARAINCLGEKLMQVAQDPDTEAMQTANREYNCSECDCIKVCAKIHKIASAIKEKPNKKYNCNGKIQ